MGKRARYFIPLGLIVAMFAVGQLVTGGFASPANINNILTISCVVAVATFAQSFVIMAGDSGIDLSVGSVMSMSALVVPTICGGDASRLPLAIAAALDRKSVV